MCDKLLNEYVDAIQEASEMLLGEDHAPSIAVIPEDGQYKLVIITTDVWYYSEDNILSVLKTMLTTLHRAVDVNWGLIQ